MVNKVTVAALKDLELRHRKAALLPEGLKMVSMVRIQMKRDLLMKAESFEVNVLDPYEEVGYLGVWIQPAMFVQRAIEAATQQAVKIASAMGLACTKPWEATMVSRCMLWETQRRYGTHVPVGDTAQVWHSCAYAGR